MSHERDHHAQGPAIDIAPRDAVSMLRGASDVMLLDCRTPEEVEIASIEGATVVPMQEIPQRVDELEPHREKAVLVFCHAGVRSRRVASWLREQGFEGARSIVGGIDRWAEEIDPSIPRY